MALFFRLDGTRVMPNEFGNSIARTMTMASSMRCPQHQKAAMVVVDDGSYGYPGIRISGCCQEFIETIAERLK